MGVIVKIIRFRIGVARPDTQGPDAEAGSRVLPASGQVHRRQLHLREDPAVGPSHRRRQRAPLLGASDAALQEEVLPGETGSSRRAAEQSPTYWSHAGST